MTLLSPVAAHLACVFAWIALSSIPRQRATNTMLAVQHE
jgi:hypothetical protein